MDLPISIPCPSCNAKLEIKDEALLGRTVKCPKCGERFAAEAPTESVDGADDFGDEDAAPPELPKPRAKKPPAESRTDGKNSKKKSKKAVQGHSSKNTRLLIVGGGVAAALLFIGIGVVAWTMWGRGAPNKPVPAGQVPVAQVPGDGQVPEQQPAPNPDKPPVSPEEKVAAGVIETIADVFEAPLENLPEAKVELEKIGPINLQQPGSWYISPDGRFSTRPAQSVFQPCSSYWSATRKTHHALVVVRLLRLAAGGVQKKEILDKIKARLPEMGHREGPESVEEVMRWAANGDRRLTKFLRSMAKLKLKGIGEETVGSVMKEWAESQAISL